MEHDKPASCPKCGESTVDLNKFHSGLKTMPKNINGIRFLLIYCANCGAIVGTVKD